MSLITIHIRRRYLVKWQIKRFVIEICEPCRQRRLDEEKREQLKYSKAKIFIKVIEKEEREKYNGIDDKVKNYVVLGIILLVYRQGNKIIYNVNGIFARVYC